MPKDLSKFQIGSLQLQLGGKTFEVKPPSSARGIMLVRIVTMGFQAALNPQGLEEDSIPDILGADVMAAFEMEKDFALEKLALGADAFDAMVEANIALRDITMAARYASYYWVFDEETADHALEDEYRKSHGQPTGPTDTELPKP